MFGGQSAVRLPHDKKREREEECYTENLPNSGSFHVQNARMQITTARKCRIKCSHCDNGIILICACLLQLRSSGTIHFVVSSFYM